VAAWRSTGDRNSQAEALNRPQTFSARTFVVEKTDDLNQAVSRLAMLQSQDALILLWYSLSIPKLLYTLRTSDCQSNLALIEFDNSLRNGLSTILNVELSDD